MPCFGPAVMFTEKPVVHIAAGKGAFFFFCYFYVIPVPEHEPFLFIMSDENLKLMVA